LTLAATLSTVGHIPAEGRTDMSIEADIKALLDKHLDEDFSVFAAGDDAPSEEVVWSFEEALGYQLPDEFRDFSMSPLGGIYIEVKPEIWPPPKPFDSGPFWTFLRGMTVLSFASTAPDWMAIHLKAADFRERTGSSHTPFLKIAADADVYCFTSLGAIVRWNHETGGFDPVERTFLALFEYELERLRRRKDMKKAGVA
jgi:hypothetical protein